MPRFKTNKNVFEDLNEYFKEDWFKSSKLVLPKTYRWNKVETRPMTLKDVQLWEVLCENSQLSGGFFGVYAAWKPYGDLIIIVQDRKIISQYLGDDSLDKVNNFLKENNLHPVVRYNETATPNYVSSRKR